jgi:hypothetical protein
MDSRETEDREPFVPNPDVVRVSIEATELAERLHFGDCRRDDDRPKLSAGDPDPVRQEIRAAVEKTREWRLTDAELEDLLR